MLRLGRKFTDSFAHFRLEAAPNEKEHHALQNKTKDAVASYDTLKGHYNILAEQLASRDEECEQLRATATSTTEELRRTKQALAAKDNECKALKNELQLR